MKVAPKEVSLARTHHCSWALNAMDPGWAHCTTKPRYAAPEKENLGGQRNF